MKALIAENTEDVHVGHMVSGITTARSEGEPLFPCIALWRIHTVISSSTTLHKVLTLVHTVCDFMLTFRSYRTNRTIVFFSNRGKNIHSCCPKWNDRRTICFQTIQWANSMATRVQLCSFQSSTNANAVSPVSDRSIAHEIVTFCNHSDAVRKMSTVERCVERLNHSIKRNENGMER